jgi:hypothetical protein
MKMFAFWTCLNQLRFAHDLAYYCSCENDSRLVRFLSLSWLIVCKVIGHETTSS